MKIQWSVSTHQFPVHETSLIVVVLFLVSSNPKSLAIFIFGKGVGIFGKLKPTVPGNFHFWRGVFLGSSNPRSLVIFFLFLGWGGIVGKLKFKVFLSIFILDGWGMVFLASSNPKSLAIWQFSFLGWGRGFLTIFISGRGRGIFFTQASSPKLASVLQRVCDTLYVRRLMNYVLYVMSRVKPNTFWEFTQYILATTISLKFTEWMKNH